jgi:hypothetical protein
VFILKMVKVLCFHTLLQVFILKGLSKGRFEVGGKQKSGCLVFKLAAGLLGAFVYRTHDTQMVICCQE